VAKAAVSSSKEQTNGNQFEAGKPKERRAAMKTKAKVKAGGGGIHSN